MCLECGTISCWVNILMEVNYALKVNIRMNTNSTVCVPLILLWEFCLEPYACAHFFFCFLHGCIFYICD